MPSVPVAANIIAPLSDAGRGSKHQRIFASPSIALTPDPPAQTDVRSGVHYQYSTMTGNMTEPPTNKVESGYQYGANGTEFTGTMAAGGGGARGFAW